MTHGKRTELDVFSGMVVGLGADHGIDVPACGAVCAVLEPWAERNAPDRYGSPHPAPNARVVVDPNGPRPPVAAAIAVRRR